MSVSADMCLTASPTASVKPLDDGAVIGDLATGQCWELNRIGYAIWQLLVSGSRVAAVVATISTTYGVSADVADSDVRALVTSLLGAGLIELAR